MRSGVNSRRMPSVANYFIICATLLRDNSGKDIPNGTFIVGRRDVVGWYCLLIKLWSQGFYMWCPSCHIFGLCAWCQAAIPTHTRTVTKGQLYYHDNTDLRHPDHKLTTQYPCNEFRSQSLKLAVRMPFQFFVWESEVGHRNWVELEDYQN